MGRKIKILLVLATVVFLFYVCWWFFLQIGIQPFGLTRDHFTDSYGVLALVGGVSGLFIARGWGGFKSQLGRALMAFSLGLLAQAAGQFIYTYYYYVLELEVPYPSWGDVGYFGSVLLYIYGIYSLAKVSGAKISLKLYANKIQAFIIPFVILSISYAVFLRGYEFDSSQPLTILLDFGYPLGQAIYISIAILTFMLSRKILGGVMRNKILFLLAALAVQYVADYTFLYGNLHDTWEAAGISDFAYLIAYMLMTFALVGINARAVTKDE